MYQRSRSFFDLYQGIIVGISIELNETGSQMSDTGTLVLWFV